MVMYQALIYAREKFFDVFKNQLSNGFQICISLWPHFF